MNLSPREEVVFYTLPELQGETPISPERGANVENHRNDRVAVVGECRADELAIVAAYLRRFARERRLAAPVEGLDKWLVQRRDVVARVANHCPVILADFAVRKGHVLCVDADKVLRTQTKRASACHARWPVA